MSAIKERDLKLNSQFPINMLFSQNVLSLPVSWGASVMFPLLDITNIYHGSPQNVHLLEIKNNASKKKPAVFKHEPFLGVKSSVFEETM